MSEPSAVLAVDLGGTKLATAVVDCEGTVSGARKVPVHRESFRHTLDQIMSEAASAVNDAGLAWKRIRAVGLIVPGLFDPRQATAWAPNLWPGAEVPLLAELSARLPVPVHIDSDRAGYVLGERWMGIARDLDDVVFLAVGTGIGAGIVSGGRLIRGACDTAGAVGWFALNPRFKEIYGHAGCWEAEASGLAIARHAGQPSAERVVEAARRGEPKALRVIEHAVSYLAMGIANLISVLNPQMVVLGGGLMHAADLLLEPIRRAVPRWAQPHAAGLARIEITTLGDHAGLLGAARLALDCY